MTIPSPQGLKFPEPLADLADREGRTVSAGPGDRIFSAGERVTGLHIVVEGAVRVTREGPARAVVVHHEWAGGVLGEVALFTDGIYPGTATATEPTSLRFLPAVAIWRALAEHPELAETLIRRLAHRTREVIERLDRLAHLTVVQRLAIHLLQRRTVARGKTISLGMTQVALAEELGTVKEIVVRELRTLRTLGLIEPAGDGRYRILDEAGLRALASRR